MNRRCGTGWGARWSARWGASCGTAWLSGALTATLLLTALVFSQIRMTTDIADFLPGGAGLTARFLRHELHDGEATRLLLLGLDHAPPADLARISRAMAGTLARNPLFATVAGGRNGAAEADERFAFDNRYLLSPASTPDAFTTDRLHAGLEQLLRLLRSSAAPLAERFGLADPQGLFLAMLRGWTGGSTVRSVEGVWFAPDRDRALMLLRLRNAGLDTGRQDAAIGAVRRAFAAAAPGPARLLLTGPAVFARDAAHRIRHDVERLSVISTLLVAALLFWRFRSLWVVAAIAVPVILSLDAAALVVQAVFGHVQGVAFGFGMTMLGVTVDYPVLLIGHRKQREAAPATWRRIGATLTLTVIAASIGLTGMVFAGVPGLTQIGVFSVAGLVAAALATRFVLRPLIVLAELAPVAAGDPARLLRIEAWRRRRGWALLPVGLAGAVLLLHPPHWERSLAALSPVPPQALALDAALRAELGAPGGGGPMLLLHAATPALVLRAEEALAPDLARLQQEGVITGVEDAARLLPSPARQRARQAALPDPSVLAGRLRAALMGLPFHPGAFDPFLADVQHARTQPPITLDMVASPLMRARLQPLIFPATPGWAGLVIPRGLRDPARFAAAFAGHDGVTPVDLRADMDALVARATRRAWQWLAGGAVAVLAVLAIGLRDAGRVVRVAAVILAAGVVTLAILTLAGIRLSLLHVVALQFVAGLGLDYALFFARPRLDQEERARTLRTLATCNGMTLLTFGTLAFCRTPVLHQIGLTVAIGAFTAMILAFLLAGPIVAPHEERTT